MDSPRRRQRLVAVALALAVAAGACTADGPAPRPAGGEPGQPSFAAASPFNTPIPPDPVLDPSSPIWVGLLGAPGNVQSVLLSVPIYTVTAATPAVPVQVTETQWGPHPTEVPIPPHAEPDPGEDGYLVLVDPERGRHYDLWRARRTAHGWVASWAAVGDLTGAGTPGSGVGAGVSRLAGVVRAAEIARGRIDHALVFSCGISAPTHRHPATKSDGGNLFNVPVPLPEGARVQLDPTIDVEALPDATPFEKTVARALQTFGAYNIDNGGYRAMGFSFELIPPGAPDPYRAAGLAENYQGMPHIPWDRLRVLRQWDGR